MFATFGFSRRLAVGSGVALLFGFSAARAQAQGKASAPSPIEPLIQAGHTGRIESFGFSPDGRLLATGGADWTVKVWNVSTGCLLLTRSIDGSWHSLVAISPDGKTLAAFLRFGRASLFDIASGRLVRVLEHGSEPGAVCFSPDGRSIALGGHDGAVSLWDYRTGKRRQTMRTHVESVGVLAFSRDGARLATGAGEHAFRANTVELWDAKNGHLIRSIEPGSECNSLAFSPDGRMLAGGIGLWIGEHKPVVCLWDLSSGKLTQSLAGHKFEIISIAFAADGRTLATSDRQGIAKVWDLIQAKAVRSMGEEDFVIPSTVSANTRMAVTPGPVHSARVYDATSGRLLRTLPGRTRQIHAIEAHPDNHTFLAACEYGFVTAGKGVRNEAAVGEVLLWDLRTGSVRGVLHGLPGSAVGVFTSKVGARVAAHDGRNVVVWDYASGKLLVKVSNAEGRILQAAISPDGATIALCGERPKTKEEKAAEKPADPNQRREPEIESMAVLELWDVTTGQKIRSLASGESYASTVVFSPDGKSLFASTGGVAEYSVTTGALLRKLPMPKEVSLGSPYTLRISRDGRFLAAAGDGERAVVWKLSDPGHPRAVPTAEYNTFSLDLAPDGSEIGIAGAQRAVPIWTSSTGTRATSLPGGSGPIRWVAFSPDGRRVLGLDADQRIRIWDRRTSRLQATLALLPGVGKDDRTRLRWLAYSPTGDYDGSLGAEEEISWRVAGRLTPGSRASFRRSSLAIEKALNGKGMPDLQERVRSEAAALLATSTPPTDLQPSRDEQRPEKPAEKLKPADARLRKALSRSGMYVDPGVRQAVAEEIRKALEEGADPNTPGVYGTTALIFFSYTGDEAGAQDLLKRNADINKTDVYRKTALLAAAREGRDGIVDTLLAHGAELKAHDGKSLLTLRGDPKALGQVLTDALAHTFNPMHVDWFDGLGTAYVLLRFGADPNVPDENGRTPVFYLAGWVTDASNPVVKLLMARNPDLKREDAQGETVLSTLGIPGNVSLARLFLEHGASADGGSKGWPPIVYAAYNGNVELVKLLLDHGANPNRPVQEANDGRTALGEAVGEGHLDVARLLLDRGAKIDQASAYSHWTPLAYAVMRQDRTAVQLLLDRGADVHVKTKEGKTLLQLLREYDAKDNFGIAAMLRKAGLRE